MATTKQKKSHYHLWFDWGIPVWKFRSMTRLATGFVLPLFICCVLLLFYMLIPALNSLFRFKFRWLKFRRFLADFGWVSLKWVHAIARSSENNGPCYIVITLFQSVLSGSCYFWMYRCRKQKSCWKEFCCICYFHCFVLKSGCYYNHKILTSPSDGRCFA